MAPPHAGTSCPRAYTRFRREAGSGGTDLELRYLVRLPRTRPRDTPVDRGRPLHLARQWHEPQPTTVSHDGGCAVRPRTRAPRCTPTGLSHTAGCGCRPEQAATVGLVTTLPEFSAWEAEVFWDGLPGRPAVEWCRRPADRRLGARCSPWFPARSGTGLARYITLWPRYGVMLDDRTHGCCRSASADVVDEEVARRL
jgi:hypothetical protein